jgi:hypothetical protein
MWQKLAFTLMERVVVALVGSGFFANLEALVRDAFLNGGTGEERRARVDAGLMVLRHSGVGAAQDLGGWALNFAREFLVARAKLLG